MKFVIVLTSRGRSTGGFGAIIESTPLVLFDNRGVLHIINAMAVSVLGRKRFHSDD